MHFTKMHGLGNDYLYYYGELEQPKEMAIKLSDRHFGIGSDGIITISPSSIAHYGHITSTKDFTKIILQKSEK